ncbi:hypothetical protein HMPREF0017_01933, partial [Acinetobacter lwoffii SH145]
GGIDFPNPEICQSMNLRYQNGEPDLYDDKGLASVFRTLSSTTNNLKGSVSYLRKDLFENYLDDTNQTFIWILWGERNQQYEGYSQGKDDIHQYFKDGNYLHKSIFIWENHKIVKI